LQCDCSCFVHIIVAGHPCQAQSARSCDFGQLKEQIANS
jgi:hypothetical protein